MPPSTEIKIPVNDGRHAMQSASFMTVGRNVIAGFISLFLRIGVSLILTPYLILRLGKDLYGIWTLCLSFSISGIFSLFSLGLQGGLVKYVAEYHALARFRELNEVFTATIAIYAGMAVIGAIGLFCGAGIFAQSVLTVPYEQVAVVTILLRILAVQILFELPALAADAVVAGMQRFDLLGLLETIRFLVLSALIVIMVQFTTDLVSLGVAAAGVAVAYSLMLAFFAKRVLPELRLVRRISRELFERMARFTGNLFLLRINAVVYNNMDSLLIGALVTTTAVTDYDIANRIHGIVVTVMGIAPMVVLPAASSFAGKDDVDSLRKLVIMGTKYTMALTLPLCLIVGVLAEEIIRFWISPAFVGNAALVRLFLVYLLFWPIQGVGWNMLIGVGETAALTRIQVVSVFVNLVITTVLLRYVGTAGAMIGTVLGNLVAFIPYLRLILRRFDVDPREFWSEAVWKTYPQAVIVAVLLAVVVHYRTAASLAEVIGYMVLSLACFYLLFAVTGLNRDERILLRQLVFAKVFK
ncbi:MAG: oligosaccharide flippase family protein [Desulfuromonadales bacterium]|nr:oligosaccharide flippase family protein [Desulfuromonadales bacterium]